MRSGWWTLDAATGWWRLKRSIGPWRCIIYQYWVLGSKLSSWSSTNKSVHLGSPDSGVDLWVELPAARLALLVEPHLHLLQHLGRVSKHEIIIWIIVLKVHWLIRGILALVSNNAAFRIHLILMWIRIRILGSTFGKSGSGSGSSDPPFHDSGSGSGSSDPHLEKVDPDPDLDPSTLNIFQLWLFLLVTEINNLQHY